MTRRSSSPIPLLLVFLIILLCMSFMGLLWGIDSIPGWVENTFGPAAPNTGRLEKVNLGLRLFYYESQLTQPAGSDKSGKEFQISPGESAVSVAQRLQEDGLIKSADAFRLYLIYSGVDRKLQPGDYELSPSFNSLEIAQKIQDATSSFITFTILPGWRAEEIAGALKSSGLNVEEKEFIQLVHNPNGIYIPKILKGVRSLEGFLYPGVYRVDRTISSRELVELFINRFDKEVTPVLISGFKKSNLNLVQAVTLASIVEREAMQSEEKPKIASVFINRLNEGMVLASDPTVQYALGYNDKQKTWWTNPLGLDDLKVDSPYNTYINPGLPPGPISNPGGAALHAVANPAETDYLYFRARCDDSGWHNFAKTYEEHLQNACP